jgi:60 kDa SS-A/Ro ribonucleoprotein
MKGSGEWKVNQSVVDALQDAFYLAFDAVEPTNKRWAFGLDVSGSMEAPIAGLPISSCEAVTALSLVSARTEPYSFTGLFNTRFTDAPFGKSTRLNDAMNYTANQNFGATDCSLLMEECIHRKIAVDVFCVMTDNEVNCGKRHPFQALKDYRDKTGIGAKLIVVATTSTGFTIADPSDAGMLDVVGFDTSVPSVMADFARN